MKRRASLVGLRLLALALGLACCVGDAAPAMLPAASAQAAPPAPGAAVAPSPWGTSARWERDRHRHGQHLCFEVRGERFQLSVWPEGNRHPALVRGRYNVAGARGSDTAVSVLTLRVETVTTKSLSNCRRSWVDRDIPFALALGTRFEVGSAVRLGATQLPGERLRLCRARVCGELLAVTSRDLDE